MKKLMFVMASGALMLGPAAQAGPLAALHKAPLVATQLPSAGALPALQGAPGSRIIAMAKGLAREPNLPSLPELPGLPGSGPPAGGGPLKQYWFVYDRDQYPQNLQLWARYSLQYVIQYVVKGSIQDVLDPCFDGEGSCGPADDPIGYVSRVPGVIGNVGNRALGLISGGPGPIPLPKRPGDQPPASPHD